jgi:hypothetical protein
VRFIPPVIKPSQLRFENQVIRIPPKVLRGQIYYEIEILPSNYLDGSEKFVIPVDEPLLLAFLTSSLFAIWVKGMGKKETITITSTTMYNNFPFPDLTNKQSGEIERAVNYVFEARAECRFVKLLDVYQPDIQIESSKSGEISVQLNGVDIYDPTTGQVRSSSTDEIACWFIDTNYNEESFFVRHAYFTGADKPMEKLKKVLKSDIDEDAWLTFYGTKSRLFAKPKSKKIAVKVINHYGDEVLKVFDVN